MRCAPPNIIVGHSFVNISRDFERMNRSKERANSDASSLAFIVHDFESISDGTENRAESKSNSTPHTLRDSNNYDNPSPFEHFTSEYKESELVDTAVDSFSSAADRSEKQRSRCSTEGCTKTVKSRGKCNAHGGGYRCSDEKCSNFAVSHGKCISHGVGISLTTAALLTYYRAENDARLKAADRGLSSIVYAGSTV